MSDRKRPAEMNVTFHGAEHSQYFQGHGISGKRWTACATGVGQSYYAAVQDALDQLADEWDLDEGELDEDLIAECGKPLSQLELDEDEDAASLHADCEGAREDADAKAQRQHEECELHYFVSIDVR